MRRRLQEHPEKEKWQRIAVQHAGAGVGGQIPRMEDTPLLGHNCDPGLGLKGENRRRNQNINTKYCRQEQKLMKEEKAPYMYSAKQSI